jgi:hypothetical protein
MQVRIKGQFVPTYGVSRPEGCLARNGDESDPCPGMLTSERKMKYLIGSVGFFYN